jgi:ABC-type lipoprotein export system ATPase subunit
MNQGLECRRLSFTRPLPDGGEKTILYHLDATFFAGQLAHISGTTGAGKSTLLHLLAGLLRPTEGEVLAEGQPVSRWVAAHRDLWRRKVGIVFQSDRLIGDLSALENVFLPLLPRGYRMPDCRALAIETLGRLKASGLSAEKVSRLSGGERQRVAIARALVTKPSILLADEPTAHQDRKSAMAVIETFRAAATAGAVVIVTAHDERLSAPSITPHRYRLESGRLRIAE